MIPLALLVMSSSAWALDGNDALRLHLSTGEVVEGWYYDLRGDAVVVSGHDRFERVPLALITEVERDGEPLALPVFLAEVGQVRDLQEAYLANPPPHPLPGVVIGLSVLWAGAGHAALGDWRSFGGYSLVEGVVLGAAALSVRQGAAGGGVLPSLLLVDAVFRSYAASDAAAKARVRRTRLGLRPDDRPGSLPPADE